MPIRKKILMIHTGGTIGMVRDAHSGVLKPDLFYKTLVKVIPELSELADIQVEIPFVVDSAELNFSHWRTLTEIIRHHIDQVDGVVILHGTDTLAYTASALSYQLMNLPIPVILTGAQKPLAELRSDARNNLINAVLFATMNIHEVAVLFDYKLMRGNRTTKSHISHFDAFTSPNFPLLAEVGIDVDIYKQNLLQTGGLFHVFDCFAADVAVLRLFPGCTPTFFQPGTEIRAILIMAYGAGTLPLQSGNLIPRIEQWLGEDKLVVVMSEAKSGRTNPALYESGNQLMKMGVLPTRDMTFEATITKLMFLLGQYQDMALIRRNFQESLAGEMGL